MAVLAWRYDKAAFRWIWARGLEMETWRFFTSNFYETLEHFVWGEGEERDRDTFAQQTLQKSLILFTIQGIYNVSVLPNSLLVISLVAHVQVYE